MATAKSIADADAVPDIVVDAVQTKPSSVVWVMVHVPEIDDPTEKFKAPAAPLAAVQAPEAVVPPCVIVAVTVSVTVAPDVENCHVPVQLPATFTVAVGAVGEPPQPDSSIANAQQNRTPLRGTSRGAGPGSRQLPTHNRRALRTTRIMISIT